MAPAFKPPMAILFLSHIRRQFRQRIDLSNPSRSATRCTLKDSRMVVAYRTPLHGCVVINCRKSVLVTQQRNFLVVLSKLDTKNWKPFGLDVHHCLSEPIKQHCKIQFTTPIAYGVLAFNFGKAFVLWIVYLTIRESPLMTMGDAVASFLEKKDYTTENFCLMGKADVLRWSKSSSTSGRSILKPTTKRWGSVVSKGRWITFLVS
jgi:hypothetical protein